MPTANPNPPPAPAAPARLLIELDSILERLKPAGLFAQSQPLEVELGSGDGSFLLEYARRHPEWNFLGVERLLGRLKKIDRKGRRLGLVNLRGVRIEAGYFLEYLLLPACATAIHVYFPDPWPKRKHQHHRLVNERFTKSAQRALLPGGRVYLRTDHKEYFAQMREVFAANADFRVVETPGELSAVRTDFEREFNAQGIATNYAAYELK